MKTHLNISGWLPGVWTERFLCFARKNFRTKWPLTLQKEQFDGVGDWLCSPPLLCKPIHCIISVSSFTKCVFQRIHHNDISVPWKVVDFRVSVGRRNSWFAVQGEHRTQRDDRWRHSGFWSWRFRWCIVSADVESIGHIDGRGAILAIQLEERKRRSWGVSNSGKCIYAKRKATLDAPIDSSFLQKNTVTEKDELLATRSVKTTENTLGNIQPEDATTAKKVV